MTGRLRILQQALGGDVSGRSLLCPTIGHSPKDRGTQYTLAPTAPGGIIAKVFNGNGQADDLAAKDRALAILGEPWSPRRRDVPEDPAETSRRREARRRAEERHRADTLRRQRLALAMWEAARHPAGTAAELHLNGRCLTDLGEAANEAIRYHPDCPREAGTIPAMVCATRDMRTGAIRGVHRTFLSLEGAKLGRQMLGTVSGCAVMLDPLSAVTDTLVVAEGIETALAARQYYDLKPIWALCSAGAIASLPVLHGVQTLVVIAENDTNGTSAAAVETVGTRWHAAGRTVEIVWPPEGFKDLNDAVMGGVR